jgi:DNA polymerase V
MGKFSSSTPIPFFEGQISGGFPSPAEDYVQVPLNLNELLIKHPAATFFVKIQGDSMQGAGLHSGDILIVDRAIPPQNNKIVVALLNGEFTVKRLKIEEGKYFLIPANPRYPTIEIEEGADFQIWGVVTYAIHSAS